MLYNYYLLLMISETIADWSKLNSAVPTKMFTFGNGLHANDPSGTYETQVLLPTYIGDWSKMVILYNDCNFRTKPVKQFPIHTLWSIYNTHKYT